MDFSKDAFHSDKKENKIYGIDLIEMNTILTKDSDDTPESKTNTVSLMKAELQMDACRNLLTVTDNYICYSVRKTLLRVINTITTEKTILRGHQDPVIDLKFSLSPPRNLLCSIDNNDTFRSTSFSITQPFPPDKRNLPHTFIWKLEQDPSTNIMQSSILNSFTLPATIVQPHPLLNNVYAIIQNETPWLKSDTDLCNRVHIGLISSVLDSSKIKTYENLPVYYIYGDGNSVSNATDVAFSPDGSHLAVAYTSKKNSNDDDKVIVYAIPDVSVFSTTSSNNGNNGNDDLKDISQKLEPLVEIKIPNLLCVQYTNGSLIATSKVLSSSSSSPIVATDSSSSESEVLLLTQVFHLSLIHTGHDSHVTNTSGYKFSHTYVLAQSISTVFPLYKESSLSISLTQGTAASVLPSLSPLNPSYEYSMSYCSGGNSQSQSKANYLILSHRRSSYVAIFALNPTYPSPTHLSAPPTVSDTSSHSSSLPPLHSQSLPLISSLPSQSLPIYHACMADLKFPVESLGSTVISGKDHHSDAEDVEHLELACYQPQSGGQAAIQQFHIPTDCISNLTGLLHRQQEQALLLQQSQQSSLSSSSFPLSSVKHSTDNSSSSGSSSSNMINSINTSSMSMFGNSPFSSKSPTIDQLASSSSSSSIFDSPVNSGNGNSNSNLNTVGTSSILQMVKAGKSNQKGKKINNSGVSNGNDFLSVLDSVSSSSNYEKAPTTSVTTTIPTTTAVIPIPAVTAKKMTVESLLKSASQPTVTEPAAGTTTTSSTVEVLHTIKTTTTTPIENKVVAQQEEDAEVIVFEDKEEEEEEDDSTASVADSQVDIDSSIDDDDNEEEVADKHNNKIDKAQVDKVDGGEIELDFNVEYDTARERGEWEHAFATLSDNQVAITSTPTGSTSSVAAVVEDSNDTKGGSRGDEISFINENERTTTFGAHELQLLLEVLNALHRSVEILVTEKALLENEAAKREEKLILVMEQLLSKSLKKSMDNVTQSMDLSVKKSMDQLVQSMDLSIKKSNEDMDKKSSDNATNQMIFMSNTIKKAVETECKKVMKPLLEEATKQISEATRQEISKELSAKLPLTVTAAVKESVQTQLTSSFRHSFESTLLPSFQAGTERMFAQVRDTFEAGMESLQDQTHTVLTHTQQINQQINNELQSEVIQLRVTVAQLEAKLDTFMKTVMMTSAATGAVGMSDGSGTAAEGVAVVQEPLDLFRQGRISDALECALETKKMEKLIELLTAIETATTTTAAVDGSASPRTTSGSGPAELSKHCDSLLQLCAVQQLAADFAIVVPLEGTSKRLEWIKSLIMHLLYSSSEDITTDARIPPVLSNILHSLQIAHVRILNNINNNKTEEETATITNATDLRMVIALLSAKC